MLNYVLSRLLTFVPTFVGATLISFAFIRVLPGDPIIVMAGERGLTEERYAELSEQFGFDRPIIAAMILALLRSFWVQVSTKFLSTLSLSNGAERR